MASEKIKKLLRLPHLSVSALWLASLSVATVLVVGVALYAIFLFIDVQKADVAGNGAQTVEVTTINREKLFETINTFQSRVSLFSQYSTNPPHMIDPSL